MISIPYYLDFFITKDEIDQPYWMVGSHRASQNNTIFGFVFESPTKKMYRNDIAYYMSRNKVNYDRVTVRNKGFTISILKTSPDNKERFYPHKFRYYSDLVSVIVKSPELLEKTNGKGVILYMRADLLVGEISKYGLNGMDINNTYRLKMIGGSIARQRTVISLEDESGTESLDCKLGYYKTLPKTTKLEPGYLYVMGDDKFFIYLGKINESIQTTSDWSHMYGNSYGYRFNSFNVLDIINTAYDLSVKNNDDLVITVSDNTRDSFLGVIDRKEVLNMQKVLTNLINNNRVFDNDDKVIEYYSDAGIAVSNRMKTKLSATKIGKVISFDNIDNNDVNKVIKTVSLEKFLSNGKKLNENAFYLLKLNPDILRYHVDPKVLLDYTINGIINKTYYSKHLASCLLKDSYPIGGYNLSGIKFLVENTIIDKTDLPKSKEEFINTIKDLLKKKYSL